MAGETDLETETPEDARAPARRKPRKKMRIRVGADGAVDVHHMKLLEVASVTLSETALGTGTKLGWNQVAKLGSFKGHAAGAFEITSKTLDDIVRNFDATANRHIPVDFEHASEMNATDGSIPTHGAPATGWVKKLENRGERGLWGLFEWLEPARSHIKEGRYRYLSPAIRFRSRDRVSGEPVGARLTSVGITNNPFLDSMQPLAASDRDAGPEDDEEDELAPLAARDDDPGADEGATAMTDAIKMRDLETTNDKLTLQLRDAEARATKTETDLAAARSELKTLADKAVAEAVDVAFETYKDAKALSDKDRPMMLRFALADREAFDALYPRVEASKRHLMTNLTGGRTEGARSGAAGGGAPGARLETVFEMADRLREADPKLSREDALLRADVARRKRLGLSA